LKETLEEDIDAAYSEDYGDEEVMITVAEMRGFVGSSTDALCNVVKKLNLGKERNKGLREISSVIEDIASSLDQYKGQTGKRRRTKAGHGKVEVVVRSLGKRGAKWDEKRDDTGVRSAAEGPKSKTVSTGEEKKVAAIAKRFRKGEPTYAEGQGEERGMRRLENGRKKMEGKEGATICQRP
jgi:hypothetical protein